MKRSWRQWEPLLALTLAGLALAGCHAKAEERAREYFPDMVRSLSYKAFAPNPTLRLGMTLQRPVPGTIARGQMPFHYGKGEEEAARAGRELQPPFAASARVMEEGKDLFQIYCQVCHGNEGKGDGPIAGKIPPPPSYRSERVMAFPPGRIFHVISAGAGKMPSYSTQLAPDERWKIVTYVRTMLQGLKMPAPPGAQGV